MRKLNVTELGRMDAEMYKDSNKLPVTVILDDVRSLYNVGSVFRTATPDNNLVEIHKTALGAEQTVDWVYSDNCADVVKELNTKGYVTIAVEQVEDSIKLDNFIVDKNKRYALVLGNEVKGVQQTVVDFCKMSLEIPQYGTQHSLNVSVSAGLVIWEFARQLKDIF